MAVALAVEDLVLATIRLVDSGATSPQAHSEHSCVAGAAWLAVKRAEGHLPQPGCSLGTHHRQFVKKYCTTYVSARALLAASHAT